MTTTLLAIDDSATMRKVLELTFAGERYRVVTADSADAALAKVRSERPALVLADVTLEGTNGYTLCQRIKAESPTTPVIILSSRQQPYDAAKGSSVRADDYIDKPFDTQQLIDKVKKALEKTTSVSAPASSFASSRSGSSWSAAAPPRPAPVPGPSAGIRHTPPPPSAVVMPSSPAQQAAGRTLSYMPAESRSAPSPSRASATTSLGAPSPGSTPAARPAPPAPPAPPAAPVAAKPPVSKPASAPAAVALPSDLASKLTDLGLTEAQVTGVLALSREVVERVVWEVVPTLAETMIKEEIARLTAE